MKDLSEYLKETNCIDFSNLLIVQKVDALNTVYIDSLQKWIRLDARGNKPGVNAKFSLAEEKLAFPARLEFGASIINVACAQETPEVVSYIRERFPDIPIMASGGKTGRSVKRTSDAGANAITYTPPSTAELFKSLMEKYREDD